jgi:hypothetical protein
LRILVQQAAKTYSDNFMIVNYDDSYFQCGSESYKFNSNVTGQ